MRLYRGLIFLICICCAVPGCTAERSEAWLPITSQDLQVKEVPGDPGAAAIQLYYGDFIDHKKKEEFNLRAEPPSPEEQVKWVRIATNSNPTQVDKENAALELENVPAFVPEDHMPPERNYKPAIWFYYLPRRFMYAGVYWLEIGRVWDRIIEDFIGNRKEIREAAAQVIGRETDPEKKLRLLYARAQQVRNLTFERKRTS